MYKKKNFGNSDGVKNDLEFKYTYMMLGNSLKINVHNKKTNLEKAISESGLIYNILYETDM